MSIKGNLVGNVSPRTNWNQTDSARADYLVGREKIVESISDAKKTGSDALTNSKAYTNEQIETAREQIKKARPYNLLDNADFRNPVNQRGKQSYTAQGYTIDRWKADEGLTLTIQNGYISAKNTATSGRASFGQSLGKGWSGKTLTLSVYDVDSKKVYCASATVPSVSTSYQYFCSIGFNGHSARLYLDANDNFGCQILVANGGTLNVAWAALYEGEYTIDTLPEYQPKGYGVEVVNCNNGALSMELLWENASPDSAFPPQTVSIDLSEYKIVYIFCNAVHITLEVNGTQERITLLNFYTNTSGMTFRKGYFRAASATTTGIVFKECNIVNFKSVSEDETTDNAHLFPLRIYGIKGVSA